jgi:hypothetical protein
MKKLVLVAVLAVIGGLGVYRWKSAPKAEATDAKLVTDRIWIDHMPRNDRDTINVFAALTEQPVGVFQAASQWKGAYELFRYEAHGDEMRLVFPQTGDREKITAKARRCSERGMDFCLELDGASRGVKRYYSRKGWEVGASVTPGQLEDKIMELTK